ncbi:MAG: ribosome maturation factor RimP [Thermodesulfobacteriota bacterium]
MALTSEGETTGALLMGGDNPVVARVWELVEPVCASEAMELVFVEFQRESTGRVLRLYLDGPEGGRGVTLEDCAGISRQVNGLLDVYLPELENYSLEVSSAGLDRPLAKEADFNRFAGSGVRVRTAAPVSGRKNFKGTLLGVSGGNVRLMVDGKEFVIPYGEITKAKLVNEYGVSQ